MNVLRLARLAARGLFAAAISLFAINALAAAPDLGVTVSHPGGFVTRGTQLTYTVLITNSGTADAVGAAVNTLFSAFGTVPSWSCVATPGSFCTASGTGDVAETAVTVLAGGTLTYTVVVNTDPALPPGSLNATATVDAVALGDVNSANDSYGDFTAFDVSADLSATIDDGVTSVIPGLTPLTYTITVFNPGPSAVLGTNVFSGVISNNVFPTAVWTCTASPPSVCAVPSGVGDVNTNIDIYPLQTVTLVVSGVVKSSQVVGGTLFNNANVSPPAGWDNNLLDNNPVDNDTLTPQSDMAVTVLHTSNAVAGGSVGYTVTVNNFGPSDALGANFQDAFPAAITNASWTCVSGPGAAGCSNGSGTLINQFLNIPAGSSVTYTVTGNVDPSTITPVANTATIGAPATGADINMANNSSTDAAPIIPIADLGISVFDGVSLVAPSGTVTYTIQAGNSGPGAATGATVNDTFPAILSSITWTCVGSGGATCTGSGSGNISDTVNLPAGSVATYTVHASIGSSASGTLSNTATITAPGNVTDPPGNNSQTSNTPIGQMADLAITITDGVTSVVAGTPVTYTITASNAGPNPAPGSNVSDSLSGSFVGGTWTCVGAGGGTCTASGSGSINDTVDLPVGGSVTYTLVTTVSPAAIGSVSNSVSVSAPAGVTDANTLNNFASDGDSVTRQVDLAITKTDGVTTATPGGSVTYTITASNAGPSNAANSKVADTFPAGLTATWTCVGAGGGTCPASGSGNFNSTVNLPAGGSVTFTASASISAALTGTLSNTATVTAAVGVTDTNPANNSATDTDTLVPQADLAITVTDGVTTAIPGGSVTYTITASNAGPSNVTGATVADTFPAILTPTWTCVGAGGGTCTASGSGNINDSVNLPSGGSVTYTVSATINASATGTLSNTATVSSATADPVPGNNSATDTDTLTPQANLAITKTDGVTTATPGGSVTYTITASNAGPSNAPGSTVADTFPASLTGTWTCVGAGGGTCTASGSGNINDTVNLPVGGSVTYTASATISASATGTLSNTATVAAPAGVTDPTPGNNSATDTDTLAASADLSITATDGVTTATPGGSVTYTITASNAGPSNATGATVADTFPASLTCTWTCVGAGGGTCTASGSGNINNTVNLPAGGSVTHTASCTISAAATGTLSNTATVVAPAGVTDPNPGNNSATDTDTLGGQADVSITVTDGVTTATPGGSVTYTITASNAGPSNATGATVADTFPASITATWTCVGAGGGTCTASGSGNINDTVNLPSGGSVTYTVSAHIASAATGTLSNTATVAAPAGVTDPTPGNNSATDTDTLSLVSYSGASATGTGTITATLTGTGACTFTSPQFIGAPPGAPPIPPTAPPGKVGFPQGLFDFTVTGCTSGTSVTFTITYPQTLPSGTVYWKYGPTAANPTAHWYVLPATIVGNTATFTIVDGGLGDDDLTANGVIVDQGGPGFPNSIPALDWRALLLLTLLVAAAGFAARRGRSAIR